MAVCGLQEGRGVGILKKAIEEAILDGRIPNEHDAALEYLLSIKDRVLESQEGVAGMKSGAPGGKNSPPGIDNGPPGNARPPKKESVSGEDRDPDA
jgi:hypothetical protein